MLNALGVDLRLVALARYLVAHDVILRIVVCTPDRIQRNVAVRHLECADRRRHGREYLAVRIPRASGVGLNLVVDLLRLDALGLVHRRGGVVSEGDCARRVRVIPLGCPANQRVTAARDVCLQAEDLLRQITMRRVCVVAPHAQTALVGDRVRVRQVPQREHLVAVVIEVARGRGRHICRMLGNMVGLAISQIRVTSIGHMSADLGLSFLCKRQGVFSRSSLGLIGAAQRQQVGRAREAGASCSHINGCVCIAPVHGRS